MNNVLIELKQQLSKIADLIEDKQQVFYFDYPLHLNVGDLLIYAGTEQFFQDYQINIRLRRCWQTFDIEEVKRQIKPSTTILCHGGGNFGDLYPALQQMRELLVKTFPEHRIIVLPQTAYFSDQTTREQSAAIFAQHQDCHLFARDLNTYQLMQSFSQKVQLCPDLAHQLYGLLPIQPQQAKSAVQNRKILYFLRKDIEASQLEERLQQHLGNNADIKDWQDILLARDHQLEKLCSKLAKLANKWQWAWLKNQINHFWYAYSQRIIQRCQRIFSQYDLVITSRLHGHIFSCLLGIPNQVCDNSYGKNIAYYQQWTKGIEYCQRYEN